MLQELCKLYFVLLSIYFSAGEIEVRPDMSAALSTTPRSALRQKSPHSTSLAPACSIIQWCIVVCVPRFN